MKLFSHEVVQQQWASVDYRKNMSMIGLVRIGGHQEIVAIGSYADESDTRRRWHSSFVRIFRGWASLHICWRSGAHRQGEHFKAFSATVLRENTAMLHVFKKRYPNAKTSVSTAATLPLHGFQRCGNRARKKMRRTRMPVPARSRRAVSEMTGFHGLQASALGDLKPTAGIFSSV
jgi:hypothetical protein